MPTYEYRCEKGHTFERVQKMNDKPVARCPVCGAKASREISGGQGLIFKGSGFYITDYGKDGKGARKDPTAPATSEATGESKPDSKGEPKGESKGESKTESKPASTGDSTAGKESQSKRDPKRDVKPTKPDAS